MKTKGHLFLYPYFASFAGFLVQFLSTFTLRPKKIFVCANSAISWRARVPIFLIMLPCFPITMPFWDSCSTKIVASIWVTSPRPPFILVGGVFWLGVGAGVWGGVAFFVGAGGPGEDEWGWGGACWGCG